MFVRINQRVMNSGQAREVWFIFETAHEDMAQVHADLVRDGSLCGIRYDTASAGHGRRVVRDSHDAIITKEGLVSIMAMQDELFDDDGTPLFTFDNGEAA